MKFRINSQWIIFYIIISHLAGFLGLVIPYFHSLFVHITPFHLLIIFLIVLYVSDTWNPKFFLILAILLMASFMVEFWGVKTQVLFGNYDYRNTSLGATFMGVPLVIGPNWVALLLSSASMVTLLFGQRSLPIIVQAFIASLLMVILDFFMEPVAVYLHYWNWNPGPSIPLQNYLAWFFFSWICQCFFQYQVPIKKNISLEVLYISQVLFFLALNIQLGQIKF